VLRVSFHTSALRHTHLRTGMRRCVVFTCCYNLARRGLFRARWHCRWPYAHVPVGDSFIRAGPLVAHRNRRCEPVTSTRLKVWRQARKTPAAIHKVPVLPNSIQTAHHALN